MTKCQVTKLELYSTLIIAFPCIFVSSMLATWLEHTQNNHAYRIMIIITPILIFIIYLSSHCGVCYHHHIKIQVMQVGSHRKKEASSDIADAWEHFLSPHLSSKCLLSGKILLVTYIYTSIYRVFFLTAPPNLLSAGRKVTDLKKTSESQTGPPEKLGGASPSIFNCPGQLNK